MNVPSINPQLRNTIKNRVVDYVFVIRETEFGPNTEKIADVDCYIDDKWSNEESMKGMSVRNARDWWNTLVNQGFERILTP